jgi:deazaflavin-dependent oxidoreductase (nitroreductase family)
MRGLFAAMGVGMFRLVGRRMRVQGRPLLLLTTRGARTGATRRTALGWFPDDREPSWIVVGSGAGAATHPGWAFNLAKHPDDASIEVDGRVLRVRAETLHGAERERAWARIVELTPGYGRYAQQTDREIPVIRLTPA